MPQTATAPDYPQLAYSHVRPSGLASIHQSREPRIVKALQAIPEYVETRRAVLEVVARTTKTPTTPVPAADALYERILAAVDDGEPLPEDLASLVPDLASVPTFEGRDLHLAVVVAANGPQALIARVTTEALERARTTLVQRLDDLVGAHGDVFAGAFTAELVDLVSRARQILTGPRPITSAQDAIDQGRTEEWKQVRKLLQEYRELHRVQDLWARRAGFPEDKAGARAFARFVRNPGVVDVDLTRLLTDRAYRDDDDEAAFRATRKHQLDLPGHWDEEAGLWWFVAHPDAEPWVPTHRQYAAAQQALDVAETAHRRGAPRRTRPTDPLTPVTADPEDF